MTSLYLAQTPSTSLGIADELRDKEFRDQFFRTEREIDIPAQLKAMRKLRGINQKKMAEMTGTKQSGNSRLERSSHGKWNLETLVKFAEALDARLSVVIEPYEAVIARYRVEEQSTGQSAATAVIESSAPRKIPNRETEPSGQVLPKNSIRDLRKEPEWT